MIEEILATVLENASLNVYLGSVPVNGDYPCVVYQKISAPEIRTHQGVVLYLPRFQITCWGKGDNAGADAIATAQTVKDVLDFNQTDFKLATKEAELDIDETEQNLYRRILDYFIWSETE